MIWHDDHYGPSLCELTPMWEYKSVIRIYSSGGSMTQAAGFKHCDYYGGMWVMTNMHTRGWSWRINLNTNNIWLAFKCIIPHVENKWFEHKEYLIEYIVVIISSVNKGIYHPFHGNLRMDLLGNVLYKCALVHEFFAIYISHICQNVKCHIWSILFPCCCSSVPQNMTCTPYQNHRLIHDVLV